MKKIICICLCVLTLFTLVSCKKSVLVSLDGGTLDQTYVENADFEDIAVAIPTKEGYVFAGWYSDAAFTDYVNPKSVTDAQKDGNRLFAKWIKVEESKTYNVRTEPVTITDSGRANQRLDEVLISNDYNITDLIRAGYTSLKVKITLSVSEEDDGYQYIFIYKDKNCVKEDKSLLGLADKYIFGNDKEDPSMLYSSQFEHDPSAVCSEFATFEFETTLKLSDLNDNIYLRYGASGDKDDNWINKDVVVTVSPIK